MVRRSTVAVALVAVLVVLSGCSAVLDDGGNGDGEGGVSGADTPSDASEFAYADGYGSDGVTDGRAAVESHNSGLTEAGSYNGTYSYDLDAGDQSTRVDGTNRVDFDSEQAYQEVDVETQQSTGLVEVYRDTDTRYQRSRFQNQTSTRSSNQAFVAENLTTLDPIRPLLTNVSGYDTSLQEMDGETVVVYETSGDEDIDSFYGVNDSANISSFSGQFAVGSDGIVRSASYEMTYDVGGEERTLRVEHRISGIGETSVERPGWVDDV